MLKGNIKGKLKSLLVILVALAAVVGLFVFMFSGDNAEIVKSLFNDNLSEGEFKEKLQSFGIRGAVTLSLLSMMQVVLTFLPAEPVQVLSGIGYGFGYGFLICLIGVILGNTVIYILNKACGSKVSKYFHKNIDLDFDKLRHSKKVAFFVLLLYFLPAIPYGMICFFSASLDLKYPKYILLTTFGSSVSIVIGVSMGHLAMSTSWIISIIVFCVLVALIVILAVKRKALFKKVNDMIHKSHEPYKSDTVAKKPNPFILYLSVLIMKIVIWWKLKAKVTRKAKLEHPAVLLCTHGSFVDFAYVGCMTKGFRPRFITARLYFYKKNLAWLLRKVGSYPKSMFSRDVENLKNGLRVISEGGVLAMMPEARLSTVGKFEDIQDTTYKFIKKLGVPVYIMHADGSYFARPKWGDGFRKGAHVEIVFDSLFTAEQVKSMSEEELKVGIEEKLYYDDFKWLEKHPTYRYKSKTLAEGLENILFRCPNCGKELTIETKGREVSCSHCGMHTRLNDRYGFDGETPFDNFQTWYEWQKGELEKEFSKDPAFNLSEEVELYHSSFDGKKMLRLAGKGRVTLSREGLTYKGTDTDEEVEKHFPMSILYRVLFGAGEDFEVYDGKEIWYFVPPDKRSCVKWYVASEIMKNASEKEQA